MTIEQPATAPAPEAIQKPDESVTGRSVFLVETTGGGIAVQTAFLTQDEKFIQMPAIFPNVEYAYEQIDALRRLVGQHFAQAAQVGAQVIAQQAGGRASKEPASDQPARSGKKKSTHTLN